MKEEKAIFAAGCFWHVEKAFSAVPGVVETKVGYTGGSLEYPSYREVGSGRTGHAEAIEITFDSDEISYEELLEMFWMIHNPTSLNRQGFDVGTNYRSAVFYKNEEQRIAAMKSLVEYQKGLDKKIVTQIVRAKEFYLAEEYHQKYYMKHEEVFCNV